MDIVYVFNGLGNQMSQYAFYLAKKRKAANVKYVCLDNDHNGFELDRIFGIVKQDRLTSVYSFLKRLALYNKANPILLALRKLLCTLGVEFVVEKPDYQYNDKLLEVRSRGLSLYIGGWHNYRYLEGLNLRNIYKFNISLLNEASLIHLLDIKKTNSIGVHIRRGDYLDSGNVGYFGNICTEQYYQSAISYIREIYSDPHFYFFTNDEKWVEEHFNLPSMTIVSCNKAKDSWMDMCLMSSCKSIIIANSTFSWWAAYLSDAHPIIRPKQFNNLPHSSSIYPIEWVCI